MNKIRKAILAFPAVITLLSSSSANAQNLLMNGDMEVVAKWDYAPTHWTSKDPTHPGFTFTNTNVDAFSTWLTSHGVTDYINSPSSNDRSAFLREWSGGVNTEYSLCQQVSVTAGTYALSGLVAVPAHISTWQSTGRVMYQTYIGGVPSGYTDVVTLAAQETVDFAHNITVGAGVDTIEICFGVINPTGSVSMIADGFSLIAVPEPSSALLLGLGSLSLLARRKRA